VRESIGESSHAPTSGRRPRILHGMRSLQTRLSIRCEPGTLSVRGVSSPASSDARAPQTPTAKPAEGDRNRWLRSRHRNSYVPPLQVVEWMRSAYYEDFGAGVLDKTYLIAFSVVTLFAGLALERLVRGKAI
jgi:hypothetical protein